MTRVIKIGGRPQGDPALVPAVAAALRAAPGSLVVVHGGGDEVSTLQRLHGVAAQFHEGRRITSVLDLEIIRMALSGSANKRLVAAMVSAGVPAVGVSGEDAGQFVATPVDPDRFGYVGAPSRVDVKLLRTLLAGGFLPVVSPVSRSSDPAFSATLNVNGDDAAAALATALGAEELLLVSDVPGVLADGVPVGTIGPDEAQRLLDSGVAQGGMRAKIQAALSALEGGVERVRISDIAAIEMVDRGTVLTRVETVCT